MEATGGLTLGSGNDSSPSIADTYRFGYLLSELGTNVEVRIHLLGAATALLLGVQVLLGSRRRRCSNKKFLLVMWGAYSVSYPVVSYTIGVVQSVGKDYSIGGWWVVGLLLLLGSADAMSAFSRHDVEQRKAMQAQHTLQTLLMLWLLLTRGGIADGSTAIMVLLSLVLPIHVVWILLQLPFFLCWVYSIVKMAQRMKALRMASSSHGLVRSSMAVADYMHAAVERERAAGDHIHDATTMRGYAYPVLGEEESTGSDSEPPYYRKNFGQLSDGNIVTVEMIWDHHGELLHSGGDHARALKDTCLSFALFKLLRRRFCGLDIAEARLPETREFVVDGLLAADYHRAFRVVELELSFLYDFFYTKYPALFPAKRAHGVVRSLFLLVVVPLLVNSITDAVRLGGRMTQWASTVVFSDINNLLVGTMIVAVEVMQVLATGYSDWAVVHFVCDYVRSKKRHGGVKQWLIKRVAARRARTSVHWQNKLGQYSLLASFGHRPYMITKALSALSLGLMDPPRGLAEEPAVKLRRDVKEAVLHSLKKSRGDVAAVGSSLVGTDLHWACRLTTHTHTVLVWHIATTLCYHDEDAVAAAAAAAGSADELPGRLVAASLSGYCAYLLAFVPGMLPDHPETATQILDAVVRESREHLGGCGGMPEKCRRMKEIGLALAAASDGGEGQGTTIILEHGARLYCQLMEEARAGRRWELLAGFWVELLLHLAPSDNADVHAEGLTRGGEFMTHLWAMLTHAGVLNRPDPNGDTGCHGCLKLAEDGNVSSSHNV